MKILIVGTLQHVLKPSILIWEKEGWVCELALNFFQASEALSLYEYDCVLVLLEQECQLLWDILCYLAPLNRTDGLIFMYEKISLSNKIKAFEQGADDCLEIPFSEEELYVRIKAIVRRKKFHTKNKIYFANLMIDINLHQVLVWDSVINLTKKEYEILLHLIANKNRVLSKTLLAEYLWGNIDDMNSFDMLFAHMKNLRKKLKEAKAEIEIKNSYNIGYQIVEL